MFDLFSLIKKMAIVFGLPTFDGETAKDVSRLAHLPKWLRIALRFKNCLSYHQVGLLAAGIAFYFLLAAFPAIAAIVSVSALLADPDILMEHMELLDQLLPPDAASILTGQVIKITTTHASALSLSFAVSFVMTFWAASKGVRALIRGFNVAYGYQEGRNVFLRLLLAYGITVGAVIYLIISLVLIAGIPTVLNFVPYISGLLNSAFMLLRWPVLFAGAMFGLQMIYNLAPAAPRIRWNMISWGAVAATILWVGASSAFSFFVTHFGKYNEVYGSLSAVIVLLMWFWISGISILAGAELNAAIEWDAELNSQTP